MTRLSILAIDFFLIFSFLEKILAFSRIRIYNPNRIRIQSGSGYETTDFEYTISISAIHENPNFIGSIGLIRMKIQKFLQIFVTKEKLMTIIKARLKLGFVSTVDM
jgi:hypothetical protein